MANVLSTAGRAALLAIALLMAVAVVAACSSADSEAKGNTSAAASGSGSSSGATKAAVDASGAITIIGTDKAGTDNRFEPKEFTAPANQRITVTLDNKGSVIHNFQIVGQKGPDGQEIQTPLLPAGQKGSVEFTLPAGTYDFYCVVHPVDMRGKLIVQ